MINKKYNNKEIYLLTGNKGKIMAAQNAFDRFDIKVNQIDKDYPEIQASNSIEIAKQAALAAAKEFNVPVVREDHSMFIESLGGFPGPYTNYFDKTIPVSLLLELMEKYENRNAEIELAAVLAYPNGKTEEFSYRVPLEISKEARGDKRNWDKVLMLRDTEQTFAEGGEEERVNIWNRNYLSIGEKISNNKEN